MGIFFKRRPKLTASELLGSVPYQETRFDPVVRRANIDPVYDQILGRSRTFYPRHYIPNQLHDDYRTAVINDVIIGRSRFTPPASMYNYDGYSADTLGYREPIYGRSGGFFSRLFSSSRRPVALYDPMLDFQYGGAEDFEMRQYGYFPQTIFGEQNRVLGANYGYPSLPQYEELLLGGNQNKLPVDRQGNYIPLSNNGVVRYLNR